MEKMTTVAIGKEIEDRVCAYLEKKGIKLIEANYHSKMGEIDLIMRDGEFIAFVEVRYRKSSDYGDPIATVSRAKQRRIIRTAIFYLQKKNLLEKVPCRFDVVAVQLSDEGKFTFEWIKSAFDAVR